MIDLHQELMRIIKEKTPESMNPVDMLSELLSIKKEAAYRRLRNESFLTLDEVVQIAVGLNISLDELIQRKQENEYRISMLRMSGDDLFTGYYQTIVQIINALDIMSINPSSFFYGTNNKPLHSHILKYPTISKFRIFTSDHQFRKESVPKKMSDFVIPHEIRKLEESFIEKIQKITIHNIWSKDLFIPFVTDIQYFLEIGLLSTEEVTLLKNEAIALLKELEKSLLTGKMESGAPFYAYISNTYIDTNYIYMECPFFTACSVNVFGINFYSSTDPELSNNVKEWIESIMKYSTLISGTGLVERMNFINDQYKILDKLK